LKVIFLDIDGVLIRYESLISENPTPSPECIENLNRIINGTDAAIVISSSWKELGLDKVTAYLREWGVIADVIDVTPSDLTIKRGQEIQLWLDANPGLESFLIIDDLDDMGDLSSNFILINDEVGLTREDADKAILLLEKPRRLG
jgi:hypothetical protein